MIYISMRSMNAQVKKINLKEYEKQKKSMTSHGLIIKTMVSKIFRGD